MIPRLTAVSLLALLAAVPARADVTLPAVFSNHMILQADMPAPIFGRAALGEQVAVELNGQRKTVTADKDGKWLVRLDPLKAGGPYELKVTAANTLTVKDVLVGEVWLASGQSNMRFPLSKASDAAEAVAGADLPRVRYLRVGGPWQVCSPRTAGAFSAVAFHFAADLHKQLGVPVGIIENSVSGAVGQAFMSKAAFEADPELAALVKQHGEKTSEHFENLFLPIIPYAIRGALWYQGEGNRDYPVTYRRLLPALIADWRKHWGQGDFPFLIVQLANYQERRPDPWEGKDCALREAQLKSLSVPKTALVVTIDLGIAKDVHYPNKRPVGQRLALAARGVGYGEPIEYSGPLFSAAKMEGGKAIVSFTHVGGGLSARDGGKLTGFLLCGRDRKFVRADAVIEGDRVVVSSDKVPEPIAVRYAWERNPDCNLCSREGLPASPFRSDDFVGFFTRDGTK
jgi:sialate O-acetylesterase